MDKKFIGERLRCNNCQYLGNVVSNIIINTGLEAINIRDNFMLGLSGGNTPKFVFEQLLVNSDLLKIDWNKVHFFWIDERCVPPDSYFSNYGTAYELFLKHIKPKNVFRIMGEMENPNEAANLYQELIIDEFCLEKNHFPQFDLLLIGYGNDGHIASLFPKSKALDIDDRIVTSNYISLINSYRVTLTLPVLNASKKNVIIASGKNKISIMNEIKNGEGDKYPLSKIDYGKTNATWVYCESEEKYKIKGIK